MRRRRKPSGLWFCPDCQPDAVDAVTLAQLHTPSVALALRLVHDCYFTLLYFTRSRIDARHVTHVVFRARHGTYLHCTIRIKAEIRPFYGAGSRMHTLSAGGICKRPRRSDHQASSMRLHQPKRAATRSCVPRPSSLLHTVHKVITTPSIVYLGTPDPAKV